MLIGTMDWHHIIQPSVTLTLAEGHKISTCWFHLLAHYSTEWDEILYGDEAVQVEILMLLLGEMYWTEENNCYFADWFKNLNTGMHADICEPV